MEKRFPVATEEYEVPGGTDLAGEVGDAVPSDAETGGECWRLCVAGGNWCGVCGTCVFGALRFRRCLLMAWRGLSFCAMSA